MPDGCNPQVLIYPAKKLFSLESYWAKEGAIWVLTFDPN